MVDLLDLGDILGVEGYLFRTHTGEITLYVESLSLLAKNIRPLPVLKEKVVNDQKVVYDKVEDKELRYRQRHVDLIVNREVKDIFRKRVAIINKGRIAAIDTPEKLKRTLQESQSVEVSFDKRFDNDLFEKNELVNRMERLGDKHKLYTDNPDKLVKYLAGFAGEQKLMFTSIEICGASLEDTFVKLTEGKSHEN